MRGITIWRYPAVKEAASRRAAEHGSARMKLGAPRFRQLPCIPASCQIPPSRNPAEHWRHRLHQPRGSDYVIYVNAADCKDNAERRAEAWSFAMLRSSPANRDAAVVENLFLRRLSD